jgi:ubiquinone/menaquinone biosynthesis C-methylase UbiE
MAEPQIRFDDGAAYERMMGVWSRLAGEIFLDWLAPRSALRWIDVGCGNGAFTELIVKRHAPAEVQGVDPSDGQLAYARTLPSTRIAQFRQGDAMELPFPSHAFDVAVMALVIFFVPDPRKGLAEMVRVVSKGGTVAAYAWDMPGGGFPLQPIQTEMFAMGFPPLRPPNAEVSKAEALQRLWTETPVSQASKRGESMCNGHSPISTTFGRLPCWHPVPARPSRRCHGRMWSCSESACAGACRRMPRAASPSVHGPTRLREACQVEQLRCGASVSSRSVCHGPCRFV